MSHKNVNFEKTLSDDDYGLIVGEDGTLKGIWVPRHKEHMEIPEEIANLCITKFNLDPNDELNYSTT
jgi:hypothetical protein|tara:strand:+ start:250 stop:450 length:201 start_codon:yes stop_codon:yes gene_type:complete